MHVGVGQLLGFDHHVHCVDGVVAVLGERKVFHDVEHGERGDALAVGRQLVNGPAAIGGRHGLDPLGPEVAEVFQGMNAALGVKELDHGLGHGAVVVGIAAMRGDLPEGVRQRGVPEEVAGFRCRGPDDVGLFVAGLVHEPLGDPVASVALGERKSVLRIVDGRGEQLAEGQGAEARACGVPSRDRAGDVDGLDADGIDFRYAFGLEVIDGQAPWESSRWS